MKEQTSAGNPKSAERMEVPLLLSDQPCTEAGKIRFGHESYVEAIQDAVATCPTPFAIGLYGKWGTGKTTVLQALKSRVDNRSHSGKHFRVCLFDAWKYSEEASFRRQFLAVLNDQLKLGWDLDKLLYRPKEEQEFDFRALGRNLLIIPLILVVIIGVVSLAYWLASRVGGIGIANSILAGTIAGMLGILLFVVGVVFDIVKMSAYRVTQPLLFAPEQFEEQFRGMLKKAGVSDTRRLVVLVDNLDRCAPDAAVATLRTIKTFLEYASCVFVVACDEDALIGHLKEKGGYKREDAKEFLRKFFQTTIRIELPPEDLRDFASEQAEAANLPSDVARVVWAASPRNPRRIIQFLNRLSLVLYIVQARESSGRLSPGEVSTEQAYLAKILVLNEYWPKFLEDCLADSDLLALADEWIGRRHSMDEHPTLRKYFGSDARQREDYEENYGGLYEFLESTLGIKVSDPRPFLSLQRSALEMEITDHIIFRDMLRLGRVDDVRSQLSQITDGVQLQKYKDFISRTIEDELRRGRLPDAIQASRVAVACFGLLPEPKRDLADIVCHTLAVRGAKEVIRTLDQSSLLECVVEASEVVAQPAMAIVIESLDRDSPHTAEFFNALPKHTPALNEEGYAGIGDFLLASVEAAPEAALGYLTPIAPGSSLANNLFGSKPALLARIAKGVTAEDPELADKMMLTFGNFKDHATPTAMEELGIGIGVLLTRSEGFPPEADKQRALTGLDNLRTEDVRSQRIDPLHQALDKTIEAAPTHEEKLEFLNRCLGMYLWVSEQRQQVTTNRVVGFSGSWPPAKVSLLRDLVWRTDLESVKVAFLDSVKHRIWNPERPAEEKEQLLDVVAEIPGDVGVLALTDVPKSMLERPEMPMKALAARSVAKYRDRLSQDALDQFVETIYAQYVAVPPPQGEPLLGSLLQLVHGRTPARIRNGLADRLKGELGQPEPGRRKRAAQHYTGLRGNLSQSTRSNVAQYVTNRLYDLRQQLTLDDTGVFDIVLEEQDNRQIPHRTWEYLGSTIESLLYSEHTPEIRGMACKLVRGFDKLPSELHEGILEQLETIKDDEKLAQDLRDDASLAINDLTGLST